MKPLNLTQKQRSIAYCAVIAIAFALAYSQMPLFSPNQNSYLFYGLAAEGYGLLSEDWFATTADPTPAFTALVRVTYRYLGARALPVTTVRGAGEDVSFGAKSMTLSAVNQFAYYLPLWTLSRVSTGTVFGSWNRAVVVGQLPLESATRAAVTVVFPFFRNADRDPVGGKRHERQDLPGHGGHLRHWAGHRPGPGAMRGDGHPGRAQQGPGSEGPGTRP